MILNKEIFDLNFYTTTVSKLQSILTWPECSCIRRVAAVGAKLREATMLGLRVSVGVVRLSR